MNRYAVFNLLMGIGLIASVCAFDCDIKPEIEDFKECCPHEEFITDDVKEKCKEHKEEKGLTGPGIPDSCYYECVVNETGVMTGHDVVKAKLQEHLNEVYKGQPDFIQVIDNAFEFCSARGKNVMEKRMHPPPDPNRAKTRMCKPCVAFHMMCLEAEIAINCPTSAWKNDDKCNHMRDFMQNCNWKMLGTLRQDHV